MNLNVPMMRGGTRSLPAELKAGGNSPWRLRAEHQDWGPGPNIYHSLAGMGDGEGFIDPGPVVDPAPTFTPDPGTFNDMTDWAASLPVYTGTANIPQWSGPTTAPIGATPPAPPSGYQWAQLINQSGNAIVQVLAATRPGTSYTQLPNGTKIVYSQNPGYQVNPPYTGGGLTIGSGGLSAAFGGSGGLMLVGGLVLMMFMMNQRGR